MSAEFDDDDSLVFIFQDDPDCQAESRLKDLAIGDPFIFRGQMFRKINNYGWCYGICNIVDQNGNVSHIHPTTRITRVQ